MQMTSVYHNSDLPIAKFRTEAQAVAFIARMATKGFGGMTTKQEPGAGNEWISAGYR